MAAAQKSNTKKPRDIAAELAILFEAVRAHGVRLTDEAQSDPMFSDIALFPKLIADRGDELIEELYAALGTDRAKPAKKGGRHD